FHSIFQMLCETAPCRTAFIREMSNAEPSSQTCQAPAETSGECGKTHQPGGGTNFRSGYKETRYTPEDRHAYSRTTCYPGPSCNGQPHGHGHSAGQGRSGPDHGAGQPPAGHAAGE